MPDSTNADRDLAAACREWIKGCTCAPAARPQDCQECTAGFLDAVLKRAQAHGLAIGSNAFDPTGPEQVLSAIAAKSRQAPSLQGIPIHVTRPMTLGVPRITIETTMGTDPAPAIDVQASEIDHA